MQWLLDLLPDWGWRTGFEIVRDALSVGVATLGTYLAWLAIKMGRVQSAIAIRQAEIVEKQHNILERELARKTDLRVIYTGETVEWDKELNDYGDTTVKLSVHNGGDKGADGFYWEILIPESVETAVAFIDEHGNKHRGKFSALSETEVFRKADGHYTHKLPPFSGIHVAKLSVNRQAERTKQFKIYWRIRAEEGMIPPEGLAEIGFKRVDGVSYAVAQPKPGEPVED